MNKYIDKLIREQFNVNDLDFSDDNDVYDKNIFNKILVDPPAVYYNILNDINVNEEELIYLNRLVSQVRVVNNNELRKIIAFYINNNYSSYSLNWLDVSHLHNMARAFNDADYNGDISKWDVSGAQFMSDMFEGSTFNGDISGWDVSSVKDMAGMFANSKFNSSISKWDVHNVETMRCMFDSSEFNQDISGWNVSAVTDM